MLLGRNPTFSLVFPDDQTEANLCRPIHDSKCSFSLYSTVIDAEFARLGQVIRSRGLKMDWTKKDRSIHLYSHTL